MIVKAVEASYLLSPMQQGMLFHSLYAQEAGGVYIQQMLCTLLEPLDAPALQRAWQKVLERHPILRTSFRWDGSKIGQGTYYGIVKDWSQDATLWYNSKLLDQAKVPHLSDTEPITYDDLLAVGKKLTSKQGGKTKVYGLGLEWAWNLYAPLATMKS